MSARDDRAGELRRRAEKQLAEQHAREARVSGAEAKRLVHELRVHQIELEMQNEELQASRLEAETLLERHTALFDFAPIGFFQLAEDGTVRASNFAGARLVGLDRAALAGRDFATFVSARDRPGFERFLASLLTRAGDHGAASEAIEVALLGGAGVVRARLTAAPLAGPAPSALLAAEDVTARRVAEDALREEARRKDEFLAALSHELRNPLAPIHNALTILGLLPPGSERAPAALAIIERQVAHLTHVVDDLLDVTRIARGKIRLQCARIDVCELVRRTVEDHRAGLEGKHLHVRCDTDAAPLWVEADASRIAQVLGNLLGNAHKFTDAGGSVHVVVRREAGWALIRVRDTGVGIAKEVVGRLFEPFSQGPQALDRSRGGLGLGLATAKGLVELHGGSMEVSSEGAGRGAEFTVRLPLDSPLEGAALPAAAPPASPRRVLVVDDNEDAAETLKAVLELRGHLVYVAIDGPSALRATHEFRPDVVLCDIGLPGMSGYDVARALRGDGALKHTMLVALSGYAQPEDAHRAAEAGFDHHVAKPAAIEEIEKLLAKGPGRAAGAAGSTAE